jgi:hypothetical protein
LPNRKKNTDAKRKQPAKRPAAACKFLLDGAIQIMFQLFLALLMLHISEHAGGNRGHGSDGADNNKNGTQSFPRSIPLSFAEVKTCYKLILPKIKRKVKPISVKRWIFYTLPIPPNKKNRARRLCSF